MVEASVAAAADVFVSSEIIIYLKLFTFYLALFAEKTCEIRREYENEYSVIPCRRWVDVEHLYSRSGNEQQSHDYCKFIRPTVAHTHIHPGSPGSQPVKAHTGD